MTLNCSKETVDGKIHKGYLSIRHRHMEKRDSIITVLGNISYFSHENRSAIVSDLYSLQYIMKPRFLNSLDKFFFYL